MENTPNVPAHSSNSTKPYESNGDFDFDLLPRKTKRVKYDGKWYLLKEASEDARMKYEGHNYKSMRQDQDKLTVVPSDLLPQGESLLVSLCLFYDDPNEAKNRGNPVHINDVRRMPHHVIDVMFEWIMENSVGLRTKPTKEAIEKQIGELTLKLAQMGENTPTDEDKAKNLVNATEPTSR